MHSNSDHLLNEHEVARELGLSVKTLRKWRWSGDGPDFIKIGRAVRYERQAIDALKEAGRRTSTSNSAAA
ncbi:MAG: helix-turn-helix domain-containing protein [Alphaproteobacteria bacterium]|nr:helix-turn-helix domain-containing protein [Alphaproteobacteria bacterium]